MIKNENFIILSSDDWNCGLKTSKFHLATRLSKDNKVLFVNSIGLRNPTLNSKDFTRIFKKISEWCKGAKKINTNLFVYTPIVLPFHGLKIAKWLNRLILKISLNLICAMVGIKKPVVFIFTPNFVDVIGYLGESKVIYYCIDELTGYKDINVNILKEKEDELLKKADCVIACSKSIEDLKKGSHKKVFYVPHGVDWNFFRTTIDQNLEIPEDILKIKKPIIGFYGFISEDWIDFDLLKFIARSRPDWSIVLIGRSSLDLSDLVGLPNVHFLGIKEFEELPKYNAVFDVTIIPFVLNKLTLSSNPLKAFEYLASGKPVVSTDIPELKPFEKYIHIAENKEDFIKCIEKSLAENSQELRLARSNSVKNEDWNERIERISRIIEDIKEE